MAIEREFKALSFHIADYVILGLMFLTSLIIGLYYAVQGRKYTSAKEYFNAGGNIGVLPATLSLLASILCSIWYVGMPIEVYYYGFHFLIDLPGIVISLIIASVAFAPVFYDLDVTSASEYLEKRFNSTIRILGSSLYLMNSAFYVALVMFIPALAISQVIGINIWISITTMCVVGTLYTALGGIRAVMWTDVFQTLIIYTSMLFIAVKGTMDVGGLGTVWSKGVEGQRIATAPIVLDPRYRYTVLGTVITSLCYWIGFYGTYQTQIQRYLSCPSIRSAQKAIWINIPALILVETIIIYIGLVVYAHYAGCDPILNNEISTRDELLTYFVMNTFKQFPGMAGLFVAGIFSGALSTVSSCLNSMTAVTIEDFVLAIPRFKKITDQTRTSLSKWIVLVYGSITMLLMLLVEKLDSIIAVWAYNNGAIFGCNMGLFVLGLFCPWVNSAGALAAFIASIAFGLCLSFGAQFSEVDFRTAPLSVADCPSNNYSLTNISLFYTSEMVNKNGFHELYNNYSLILNTTAPTLSDEFLFSITPSLNATSPVLSTVPVLYAQDTLNSGGINELFKVSPFLVQALTFFISLAVGMIGSRLLSCKQPKPVDIKLFSPVIRKWIRKYWKDVTVSNNNLYEINNDPNDDKILCEHDAFLTNPDITAMYKKRALDIPNGII